MYLVCLLSGSIIKKQQSYIALSKSHIPAASLSISCMAELIQKQVSGAVSKLIPSSQHTVTTNHYTQIMFLPSIIRLFSNVTPMYACTVVRDLIDETYRVTTLHLLVTVVRMSGAMSLLPASAVTTKKQIAHQNRQACSCWPFPSFLLMQNTYIYKDAGYLLIK